MLIVEHYQQRTSRTARYPRDTFSQAEAYLMLGLMSEVGEVADKMKKRDRDGHTWTDEQLAANKEGIGKEIGDVFWYLSELCNLHGFNMADLMQGNLDKLHARAEAGTIHGTGDNR